MNTNSISQSTVVTRGATALTDGDVVIATADIAMSPEKVFLALTDAKELESWWGSSDTYRMTKWNADLRVGGKYTVEVVRSNGDIYPASGKFLEIAAPHRLVHTRIYNWDHPTIGWQETTISYQLEPIAGGTHLVVRHDGFGGNRAAADEHADGWERVLRWLGAYAGPDRVAAFITAFQAELGGLRKPFSLVAKLQIKDGTQEKFEAAFAIAGRETQKDKGVIAYDLSREPKDSTRYVVYERWESLADLEAHLRTPHITALFGVIDELLAGAPEFRVFVPADDLRKGMGRVQAAQSK